MSEKKTVLIKEGLTRQVIKGSIKRQTGSSSKPSQPPPAPRPQPSSSPSSSKSSKS